MLNSLTVFHNGISATRQILGIYDSLRKTVHLQEETISDLLRSQIVYAVSALDRFIHQLVRYGILEIFAGTRLSTPKFERHVFKASALKRIMELLKSSTPPMTIEDSPEYIIDTEIVANLSFQAFEDPDKIKDALSYIWIEPNKFQVIAVNMGIVGDTLNDKQQYLNQRLKLISIRRNQIVHEADYDSISGNRRNITRKEVVDILDFIEQFGNEIYAAVTSASCFTSGH